MKQILLPLTAILFCAGTLSAAETTLSLQVKQNERWHAAATDIPDEIDMSHADPRTWHRLPPVAEVNRPDADDLDRPLRFSLEAVMAMSGASPYLASNIANTLEVP
jgi:hypothetical protein